MTINNQYSKVTPENFIQIRRLLQTKKIAEIVETTLVSKTRIYEIKKFIETADIEPTFDNFVKRRGPKPKDTSQIKAKVREVFGRDNALTQRGARELLMAEGTSISLTKMSRVIKEVGLTRKRLKKKSSVIFTPNHLVRRALYAADLLNNRGQQYLFLMSQAFIYIHL